MINLSDKSIIIVGFGREGISTLQFLRGKFPDKTIGVADVKPLIELPQDAQSAVQNDGNVTRHFGASYRESLFAYDALIKSAGIPLKSIEAYIAGKVVTSPTQLFFDVCEGTIIGVTGTKGKSTTTSVIYEVLKAAKSNALLCGNIGIPALDLVPHIIKETYIVMELSSHQLQLLTKSPQIAILQNIVPEHLDYYHNFDDYVDAKAKITKFQKKDDIIAYNASFEIPQKIAETSKAKKIAFNAELGDTCCFVKDNKIVFRQNGNDETVMQATAISLVGEFNVQNVMPAVIVGKILGIPNDLMAQAISQFKGLADRMEYVATVDGVDYYNDTLATIPEATVVALDTLGDRVQTLLAGGFDRGIDFTMLARRILASPVQTLILFPTTGEKIWQAIQKELSMHQGKTTIKPYFVQTMPEAVANAKEHTSAGNVCLLSPASPSFGVFKDYRDRGEQFKNAILGNP